MVTSIAALALIFTFTFLWKTNQTEFSKPSQDSVQSITKVETTQPKNQNKITPKIHHKILSKKTIVKLLIPKTQKLQNKL